MRESARARAGSAGAAAVARGRVAAGGRARGLGDGRGRNGRRGGASAGVVREQVAEIQRSRLLAAAVGEFDERGYAHTTVAHITGRARVSRRTFYELFCDREDCLVAILDEMVGLVECDIAAVDLEGLSWRERVRGGLGAILCAFDHEPVLARVCVVQALQGTSVVLAHRDRILMRLVAIIDQGAREGTAHSQRMALTGEGVVGAVLAIVYGRLARRDPGPLTGLLGELCAMIVLPYLGAQTARRELARPMPPASPASQSVSSRRDLPASRGVVSVSREASQRAGDMAGAAGAGSATVDPLGHVPMRLTYRTVRVLGALARHPGASNRQVADHAGIHDPGQVSRLLARLQRLGLLTNHGQGAHAKGEPNAWTLTPRGEQVTQSMRTHDPATTHTEQG